MSQRTNNILVRGFFLVGMLIGLGMTFIPLARGATAESTVVGGGNDQREGGDINPAYFWLLGGPIVTVAAVAGFLLADRDLGTHTKRNVPTMTKTARRQNQWRSDNNVAVAVYVMVAAFGIVMFLVAAVCLVLIETDAGTLAEDDNGVREVSSPRILVVMVILGPMLVCVATMRMTSKMREPEIEWEQPKARQMPLVLGVTKPRRQRRRDKKVAVGWCTVGATLGMAMTLAALPCLFLGYGMSEETDGYDGEAGEDPVQPETGLICTGVLMLLCGPFLTYGSVKGIRDMGHQSKPKWARAYMTWLQGQKAGKNRLFWKCRKCGLEYADTANATEDCPKSKCDGKSDLSVRRPPMPRR